MRCGVYLLTVLFFYESRVRRGGWRRGQTAAEKIRVHVVNIWFRNKLSPVVTGALAEILFKYRWMKKGGGQVCEWGYKQIASLLTTKKGTTCGRE